ncbi:MAG TPA: DMT family transporter [Pilimelia sp.]|nr:DMT family transporter [Pilimelia sp.]
MSALSLLVTAVVPAMVSAVAYAGVAVVQHHIAPQAGDRLLAALRLPGWWLAALLNGAGGLLHLVALTQGPLSVVQPLGALTLVFTLPLAARYSGHHVTVPQWWGAVTAVVGLSGLVALIRPGETTAAPPETMGALMAVTTGALAALVTGARASRSATARSALYAVAAGGAYAIGSVLVKQASHLPAWSARIVVAVGLAVLLGGAGLLLAQAAYRGMGVGTPTAILTLVNPVVATAVGVLLYGEHAVAGALGAAAALACGGVSALGVVLLSSAERAAPADAGPRHTRRC